MDETTILLVPAPGAKAEFLATVEPTGGASGGDLPFEVVLSSYTRDGWATMALPPTEPWKATWLKSVDGRGKLPGFLKYLRERKKVPMGRFEPAAAGSSGKGVIVVPFDQPSPPAGVLGDGSDASVDDLIYCRCILDENQIGRGYRRTGPSPEAIAKQQKQKQMAQRQQGQRQKQQQQAKAKAASSVPKPAPKSSRASSGMLGNLMAATKRTNDLIDTVPVRKAASASTNAGVGAGGSGLTGTAAVMAQFRQDVEQKMLDFRSNVTQTCLKVPISLATIVRDLPAEQKQSVTMDVLKYVVYEQAEEVGEDKWVSAREPSEFMDECVVAVYKEGHAPEDVLEDLNQGELPDEILQQQRAMRQARVKEIARKETKADAQRHKETVGSGAPDDEAWTLNTQKRDRRTIEEIQKEMESHKRQRTS